MTDVRGIVSSQSESEETESNIEGHGLFLTDQRGEEWVGRGGEAGWTGTGTGGGEGGGVPLRGGGGDCRRRRAADSKRQSAGLNWATERYQEIYRLARRRSGAVGGRQGLQSRQRQPPGPNRRPAGPRVVVQDERRLVLSRNRWRMAEGTDP